MMILALLRTDSSAVTFGRLTLPDGLSFHTLEPPWRDNLNNVSCIPAGTYTLKRRFSVKHRCILFEITAVPDREDVELHIGNFLKDTLGCVLLGLGRQSEMVTQSHEAFDRFMAAMDGIDECLIVVSWAPGISPESRMAA
ncbi:MAG TPA: DUF5675 family protein [Reyranella sp.]|nr:DUF5675 family protein [Reyranella sp.]